MVWGKSGVNRAEEGGCVGGRMAIGEKSKRFARGVGWGCHLGVGGKNREIVPE